MTAMHRRRFVERLAAWGCLALLPVSGIMAGRDANFAPWAGAVDGSEAARAVGRRCIAAGAAENDPTLLAEGLTAALRRHGCAEASSDAPAVRAALDRARRADFLAGDVVRVDGWVLSRTEARTYALAAARV